ncbi:hypothetical protein F0L17_12335 [Streptomyces sp. TRM43335]|uniref:Uncharacterized protein n=1 Tax=Streptomyces taklimakanensis TaxID=2569853 RepID=A0A6G2BCT9_9ACTN|nr:permease prefix domain 1-containing protein [Streptomyces taklimakanensis]MTE19889.1 hypothetical protein [Streptomyces taklimakanensis]
MSAADRPTGRVEAAEHEAAEQYGSVEEYARALASALHGPARARERLVAEIRAGLADTVEAHVDGGVPRDRALASAVREFGTVAELAPACRRELTVAQARHTARTVLLTAPLPAVCWYLVALAHGSGHHPPRAVQVPVVSFAGVAIVTALFALAVLAATGPLARRLPTPRRLPLAAAWTGTAAGASLALATLALAVSSPLATHWPPVALAGVLTAVSHAAVAVSSRACRACARA